MMNGLEPIKDVGSPLGGICTVKNAVGRADFCSTQHGKAEVPE
jgi:hypothetical protein